MDPFRELEGPRGGQVAGVDEVGEGEVRIFGLGFGFGFGRKGVEENGWFVLLLLLLQ